ncbi:transcription termination factor NusA [Candidatus Wolfebacteria bacterium]|nr:transcription termination factor NusA [Candidatus Wolfebacteria bacterium]
MIDLKVINSVLTELEEERGISRAEVIHAIEESLAHAYKKEYGKRGQVVRAKFNVASGGAVFEQVKTVVDETTVRFEDEDDEETSFSDHESEEDALPRFDPEKHILLEDARKIKADAKLGDEIAFPLETHDDFGRIAAQTAKQVLIQNIREAEKGYLSKEFGEREGEIVTGSVQRIERGNIFVDLGRATGILPYEEQIPGERYKQGERVRAYLYRVEETPRGVFLKLSRSHPAFLEKLFEIESPEVANGTVELKAIAREAGSRSKIAAWSHDEHIDPVGSLVGQRGVRVSTVMSELGGEKIDIVEWSEDSAEFIEEALSPAKVVTVEILNEEERQAKVTVTEDQQSLAIGRGGQNVRLAAKLTGWRIDIQSVGGTPTEGETTDSEQTEDGEVRNHKQTTVEDSEEVTPEKEKTSGDVEAEEVTKDVKDGNSH